MDSVVSHTPGGAAPVRKTITVKAPVEHAFAVFTSDFDSWWPRTHHIGKTPMTRGVLEGRAGGRCYTEHEDGSACDWGTVRVWEPPHRIVLAWQINADWTYQADPAQASEVEIRFTPEAGGMTRVDLDHRHLERHGAGAMPMRTAVDGPGGWPAILQLFAQRADQAAG